MLLGGPVAEKQDLAKLASPIYHVSAKNAPFLILHGANDPAVPPAVSQEFAAALQKAGVPVQLFLLPGQGHNLNLGAQTGNSTYMNLMLGFFDSILKRKS
jgi:dipeptidyl aminopeptidase/acylaminoacyl peptidase